MLEVNTKGVRYRYGLSDSYYYRTLKRDFVAKDNKIAVQHKIPLAFSVSLDFLFIFISAKPRLHPYNGLDPPAKEEWFLKQKGFPPKQRDLFTSICLLQF